MSARTSAPRWHSVCVPVRNRHDQQSTARAPRTDRSGRWWHRQVLGVLQSERELLWLIPAVTAAVAAVVGAVLARTGPHDTSAPFLLDTDAGGYREVLMGLLAALLTALSVVLSVTLVAIQTAGTNYSPRLLRNFLRDRKTQVTLAYLLGVLGLVLGVLLGSDPTDPPVLGTTLALVAVLGAGIVIVVFISHIAGSLRVEHLLDEVVVECSATIDRVVQHLPPARVGGTRCELPAPPPGALVVPAAETGYLLAVDAKALCTLATEQHVVLRLVQARGEQVLTGAPVAWAWSANANANADTNANTDTGTDQAAAWPDGPPDVESLVGPVRDAMVVGFERTLQQDISFGIRQIVDLAIKALSPAVNDPYSALQSLDHLERLLVRMAPWQLGPELVSSPERLLVAVPSSTFADHLRLATDQISRYGARDPSVLGRLLRLLRTIAGATPGLHTATLHERVDLVLDTAARQPLEPAAIAELGRVANEARAWIDGDLAPGRQHGPSLL